jgi:hypothetical protein
MKYKALIIIFWSSFLLSSDKIEKHVLDTHVGYTVADAKGKKASVWGDGKDFSVNYHPNGENAVKMIQNNARFSEYVESKYGSPKNFFNVLKKKHDEQVSASSAVSNNNAQPNTPKETVIDWSGYSHVGREKRKRSWEVQDEEYKHRRSI